MAHVLKLVQGTATLVDFNDSSDFATSKWQPDWWTEKGLAQDALALSIMGASATDLNNNLISLNRAIEAARENYDCEQASIPYTPIYLQYQETGGTVIVQSEVLGGKVSPPNINSVDLGRQTYRDVKATLFRRPYFEETAAVTLVNAQSYSNNGTAIALSGLRGDLPAPLKVTVTPGATGSDCLIVALQSPPSGTASNFQCQYTAESYATRGSGVADLADTNLSPGGTVVTAQRWTPPNTSEQTLLTWTVPTPLVDQYGRYRVLVRCRDNGGSANVKIRVRPTWGTVNGDYGAAANFAGTVGGTTAITLVDCGVISVPGVDSDSSVGLASTIALSGQASSTASTFDIDALFLLPTGGGECAAIFDRAMGTATGIGNIDAHDRVPMGYLASTAGAFWLPAQSYAGGAPPLGQPNRSMSLFVMTEIAATGRHEWNVNNTVTVTYTPRYRLTRGT